MEGIRSMNLILILVGVLGMMFGISNIYEVIVGGIIFTGGIILTIFEK